MSETPQHLDRLFLSVGAMKAGTTWLHRQLAGHPGIHFSPEKEIHYFADPKGRSYMSLAGRLDRYQRVVRNLTPERLNPHVQRNLAWYADRYLAPRVDDAWYRGLFDMRPPRKSDTAWAADFSNLYAVLDDAGWDHVARIAHQVRAIYTMRHPSERLWSNLKFSYEFSGRMAELEYLDEATIAKYFDDAAVLAHADYAGTVAGLCARLGTDAAFFFFEDVRARPLETLRRIEGFLDLPEHQYRQDALEARINPSREMGVPAAFAERAELIRVEQVARLGDLGLQVPQSWHIPLGE
ncbi:sulfotransferase [Lacimonas salitolerans]|uniref:Sulfotransferase n=1 Tax=Lacimonas salitolerans TaxID=1323750 RepID=A0ABW4EDR2_9RHOB